jgi:probable rRNA maturation factor
MINKNILFFCADTEHTVKAKEKLRSWIINAISKEKRKAKMINIILCSDNFLLKLNKSYLDHDYYTDIITFEFNEGRNVSGDIYISIDRIKENAKIFKCSMTVELERVIIHGILHLCGYADSTEKLKLRMKEKEDYYLSLL